MPQKLTLSFKKEKVTYDVPSRIDTYVTVQKYKNYLQHSCGRADMNNSLQKNTEPEKKKRLPASRRRRKRQKRKGGGW